MTVRTDAVLNYPFVLKRVSTALGHVQIGQWPEWSQNKVDLTGHDSAGNEESIPDGIMRTSTIVCTLVPTAAAIAQLRADIEAETVSSWVLSDGTDECTFNGWVKRLKKLDADGSAPVAIKWEVEIQPTGGLTWSPS